MGSIQTTDIEEGLAWLRLDGGPAFPLVITNDRGTQVFGGIKMRDYFAARTIAGQAASWGLTAEDAVELARRAYAIADAMIRVRGGAPRRD